jgi:hypothetical protein
MDPSLQCELEFDEEYNAWASQFFDFNLGERAAEVFRGAIPDTSHLRNAVPEAAATLSGVWNQRTHPELLAGNLDLDPDDGLDITSAEFWQRLGFDVPPAQLELHPSSHASDYSDITMRDDPPPASGLEPPPGPEPLSYPNLYMGAKVPSSERIRQVEAFIGMPLTQGSIFCSPPPYAPPTLNKIQLFAQHPRWASIYDDIVTFAQALMMSQLNENTPALWARNETLGEHSRDANIIAHPLYSIATVAVGVFRDESEGTLEVPAYDSQ